MRRRAKLLLAAILSGALGATPPAALGQPVAPSAKPVAPAAKPTAAPAASASAKPAASASAKPAASAGAAPAGSGLPVGHPPVDQGLPAGHPPVDSGNDDDDDDEAPPNPHGGGAQARPSGLFQPPPDTAQDDATLPVGTLVVTIRDAQDKPIPSAKLTLGILRSSVAKGESADTRAAVADGEGNVRFDGLGTGSELRYRVTTSRGPAVYSLEAGSLNDRAGKRAVLHSYDVTSNIDSLTLGINALVILSLREDSIRVEQLMVVGNPSPVSWVAEAPFTLPAGFKAFNKQDGMSEARVDEVKGKGAALRGTFAPGRHNVNFHYQVPLTKDPSQTLTLELPPHVMGVRVAAALGKGMSLQVRGLPAAQPLRNEGKRFLVTEWQMRRAEDGLSKLDITLTGLPTEGYGRIIAVALAILALILGVVYSEQKRAAGAMDPDARDDMLDAREALLAELVALERARKTGEVGPKTYARLRAALLDALARIVDILDAGKAEQKKRRRAARAAEPSR